MNLVVDLRYIAQVNGNGDSADAMVTRRNRRHLRFDQPDPYDGSYNLTSPQSFNRYSYVSGKTVFMFVLRFKPSFKTESQITVRKSFEKVEVFEYTSLSGNIYAKLNSLLKHGGQEDVAEMAKMIKVKRRAIVVPYKRVMDWHTGLLGNVAGSTEEFGRAIEAFNRTGQIDVQLNGSLYGLRYKQVLSKMSFNLYDVEIDTPMSEGRLKLVRWMNALRKEVEKQK